MHLQTLQDYQRAGRALAKTATDGMAASLRGASEIHPETLTGDFVDKLLADHLKSLDEQVAGLVAEGVPLRWAVKFRLAFLDTARKRMRDYCLAAHAPAGNA